MVPPMAKSDDVVGGLTVLILGAGGIWWWLSGDDEPERETATQAVSKPMDNSCVVSARGDMAVLVFPTEAGLDAFAVAANRGVAEEATARQHRAFEVAAGTSCERVDLGLTVTQILITAGPHEGRTGWVPTEWTRR